MNLLRSKNENLSGIDLFKFIMAIAVVAIHTHPLEGLYDGDFLKLYNVLVSVAVPYFFMASGYFLFKKMSDNFGASENLARLRTYIKRIILLYIAWTIIYLPLAVFQYMHNDTQVLFDILLFIRGFLFIGEHYYSWPLWYLLSMIYSLLIIYFMMNRGKGFKAIIYTSGFIYVISIFMTLISKGNIDIDILQKAVLYIFDSGRIFSGMIFIVLGMIYARTQFVLSNTILVPLAMIAIVLKIYNVDVASGITFIFIIMLLFQTSINFNSLKAHTGYWLRRSSVVIYFTHMLFFFVYTLVFKEFRYFGLDAFLISTLSSLVLSVLLIQYEFKFKWIKKIF